MDKAAFSSHRKFHRHSIHSGAHGFSPTSHRLQTTVFNPKKWLIHRKCPSIIIIVIYICKPINNPVHPRAVATSRFGQAVSEPKNPTMKTAGHATAGARTAHQRMAAGALTHRRTHARTTGNQSVSVAKSASAAKCLSLIHAQSPGSSTSGRRRPPTLSRCSPSTRLPAAATMRLTW